MTSNTTNPSNAIVHTTETKRIEYIDALRGFSMFLVVFQHIATFCWGIENDICSFHTYLIQIRMPMFFFISGFVLYKENINWDASFITKFLKKKFFIQIIPTIIFLLAFTHVFGISFIQALFDSNKTGYWFTYTLFLYFIFYSILRFFIRGNELKGDIVIIVIALLFYCIEYGAIYDAIPFSEEVKGLLSMSKWYYFLFFVIGTLFRKHYRILQIMLDGKWLIPICLIIYFVLNLYRDILHLGGTIGNLLDFSEEFMLSLSGLIILFAFFRAYQSSFSKDKILGFSLQYLGRRTLDVYLLHYFLIPYQLSSMVFVFREHSMPIVEAICSMLLALIVIGFSLLISNILRLSPMIAHLLFGVKQK